MLARSSVSVINVDDGNGVVSVEITYAIGSSPTTPPGNPLTDGGVIVTDLNGVALTDASWQTTIPEVPNGYYLWTRTITTYANNTFTIAYVVGYTGEDGADGAQGVSITGQKEQWYLSTSSSSLTGGAWSYEEPSSVPDGKYLWGRWEFTMSDNSVQYSDAVYRATIDGLIDITDTINQKITQKIWSTDISSGINTYDSTTTQAIRDRVTQTETDISGITSRVSATESTLLTKADGSTVTALSNTVTQNKQTADAFQQTVESTYAQLTDVDDKINNIKVGGNNLYVIKDEVPGYLHGTNGSISSQSSTNKEFTSAYIPVKEGENYVIQSWCTPSATGESWLAYQYFSNNTGTPLAGRVSKYGKDSGSGVETTADGLEHLVYKVTVPENAKYLRISYRQFNDGYAMVEKATTPSEYSINSQDLENYADQAVSSAKSEIKQTTDAIELTVSSKVGASEIISKINQSPESITISAEKVNLVGQVTFNMFDSDTQNALTSGAELIVGTQTSSTSAWTGTSSKLKTLGSGTRISYKLPKASTTTAVTLNLTLNNGTTTGAKNVYYLNDTRLTTQYGVNSIVELIYDGSAWRVINPYSDANTYDRTRYQQAIKAGSTAIVAGNIIVAGANNVGTYTHLKLGNAFDTTYPILYAGSAIAANSTGTDNYLVVPMGLTTTQSGTYTAYKAVYIKGTLSGTTFTPVSTTPLTQTIPTSADNYHYMLLGTMYSTTEMYLLGEHPIFQYYNGGFKTTTQIAAEAAATATSANATANTASQNASDALSAVNASIKSTTMHYLATTAASGVTRSTSGWTTTIQSITASKRYLWTYQTITKVDNTTSDTDPVISGVWGNTGTSVTVSSNVTTYQAGTSGTTAPTGTWESSVPTVADGQFLWTKVVTTFSDNSTATSYSVAKQGIQGTSVTVSSTSTTYQSGTSGTSAPTGTWEDTIPTVAQGNYLWTKTVVTYSDGKSTTSYAVSYQSEDGDTGVGVTKVEQLYRSSNSTTAPAAPTSVITSTSTANSTWTLAMPTYDATYKYYYTCTQTTYSDGSHTWTTVARSKAIEDANATANTANSTANTANTNASNAVSTANTANTNASAAVETANTANSTANTAIKGLKSYTGTSSTATGTAAKVVSCSDTDFEMTNGVTITITFSAANTADAPTLNVNSKGAKAIYFDNAVTSSSNKFRWQAGSVITFQYNGTYWVVLHYENIEYFTCSTSAGTAAKTNASVTGTFVLCRGTTINLYTTNGNTAEAPTLNIGSTGAYSIYYKNAVTSSSNKYLWGATATITFTFNGSYWCASDGGAQLVKDYAKTSVDWVSSNGTAVVTAKDIIGNWATDATKTNTTIKGGLIQTHTILSEQLATNAIMSNNYSSGVQDSDTPSGHYSTTGTFLDLSDGAIYMPNFGVSSTGEVFMNGTVYANAGQIGDPGNAYWEIGTVYGTNWDDHAGLIAHGDALIQAGKLTMTSDRLNSQNAGNYVKIGDYWYDFGMQVPDPSATGSIDGSVHKQNFLYIRRIGTQPTSSTVDNDWNYLFRVNNTGDIYWNGHNISEGTYVPLGGTGDTPMTGDLVIGTSSANHGLTVNGNATITGTLTANASTATKWASAQKVYVALGTASTTTTIQGGSTSAQTIGVNGTLGVGNGGTGKASWTQWGIVYASTTSALSQVAAGTSGQVLTSGGSAAPGWTNQSALSVGSATKATQDANGDVIANTYRKLTNNTFDTITVTDISAGDLVVTGAASFTNGLSGDLTGNVTGNATTATTATTATKVQGNLKIQLNSGTTEGTNQFTYNGETGKTVNITKGGIGLGNVENTAISTWAGSSNLTTTKVGTLAAAATKGVDTSISASSTSANLPTSAAVASFVEGKGYVTSSGVTSVRVQATSPVVSSTNTAQTSTLNTTISLADAYGDTKNPYGTKTPNYVLAGPSSGTTNAAPSFRALVAADIPSLTKSKISDFPTTWALSSVTGADDLKAIEALTGTSGMLKKTAANTWALTTVVSGLSINNDVITVTKSDGTTDTLSVNVTGQVVTGATVLSDSQGNPVSQGSASKPVYFSNGVPVQGNTIPTINLNGSATTSASFYAPTGVGTSGQYLKSNGSGAPTWTTFSKSTVGLGNVANIDQSKAIKSITKSGGTYTATALDNTTFTFSESVTGVKGTGESSYRTGNINITAENVNAVRKGVCEILNPFAPENKIQIDRLENAFYFADKRWNVTAVKINSDSTQTALTSSQIASLFDMSEGDLRNVPANGQLVITMDFTGNNGTNTFPNYPYGYIYIACYYTNIPASVSARVYGKHTGSSSYWQNLTVTADDRNTSTNHRWIINQTVMYNMQKLEITINGQSDKATSVQEISYYMTRADKNKDMPYVSKLREETLYYNLTAPKFIGALEGNADSATNVATQGAASANETRHVWFSSGTETQRAHDDDFKYNPSTNTLTVANVSGNASTATNASFLTHKTVNNTSLHNTAGTFAFSGSGDPWSGTDWVGLQVGDSADKFQIVAKDNTLLVRQNDNGGTNATWSNWVTVLTSSNYNSYAPTLTGTGASGTWGISISGTAAKATADASGNTITSYYCTLSTAQTVSGVKTFSGNNIFSGANTLSGNNTFSGVNSFTNTTASTSKSTGAVKVSGGMGVAGRMSANENMIGDHVVLSYNSTLSCLDFSFV